MQRGVLEEEKSLVGQWVCKATNETTMVGFVEIVSLHENIASGTLHVETVLAMDGKSDVAEVASSALILLILAQSAHLAVFRGRATHVLDYRLVRSATSQVMVLHILGLLSEDDVIVDRGLHHILEDLLADFLITQRVEDERLSTGLVQVE